MDKRLGLFLYQNDTIWVQNNEGFYYFHDGEYLDKYFLYDDPDFNLEANNEVRLGPYEMVEW